MTRDVADIVTAISRPILRAPQASWIIRRFTSTGRSRVSILSRSSFSLR